MATLIDTFVSVFTSDTDGLRQGREEARRSTDDIVKGMKEADDQANKTSRSVASMLTRAVAGIASIEGARRALQGILNRSEEIHLLNQTAEAIGTNVTQLDAFAKAVQDSGGESQAAISSIENMYRALGEAAVNATGSQAQALARSGVQLRDSQGDYRDTIDIMLDLSEAMSEMGGPEAENIAQQLGISDRRTIETMIQGRQELERTMRSHAEYGAVTAEAAERAGELDSATNRLGQGMGALRDRVVVAVLPAITWVVERLGDWARWIYENQTVVEGFFIAIAGIVARRFLPVMVSAASSVWALIAPFALAAAVALGLGAAFVLIYDDIRNFIAGNDSLIGQIAEEYPAIGRLIEWLGGVFKEVFAAIGLILDWLGEQFGMSINGIGDVIRLLVRILLGSLNQIIEWGEDFVQVFRDAADAVVSIFQWLGEQVGRLLQPIRDSFEWVGEGVNRVKSWLPGGGDEEFHPAPDTTTIDQGALALPEDVRQGALSAAQYMSQVQSEPMNSVTRESINNRTQRTENRVEIGEVTVNTQATDAKGVAVAVGDELREQMRMVNSEFSTGVER